MKKIKILKIYNNNPIKQINSLVSQNKMDKIVISLMKSKKFYNLKILENFILKKNNNLIYQILVKFKTIFK